jgi:PAS domain S-box-containing protein
MGTEPAFAGKAVSRLSDTVRSSFQIKILLLGLGGVLVSILLSGLVFFLGMNQLTKDVSAEIASGFGAASQHYYESQIEGTAEQLDLWMGHAQADLRILADITQKLIDHREEFRPMTEVLTEIPFFADKMAYYPEGGYSQNAPDEPSVVTIQTIYHDENAQIKPYPQQIMDETAILDLVMPAIHTHGAEKLWTYFSGDTDAAFLRVTPWVDFGRDAVEVYPEQLDVSYWHFWPGLVEAFEAWVQNSGPVDTVYVTGFEPYVDAVTGELVQTFAYPLWDRERSRLAGAVWYDISLNDITETIEEIELAESGFAFLARADGNILAIPERGIIAMGMEEAAHLDEGQSLHRYVKDSSDPAVAALALPQDDAVTTVDLQLATGEFVLIMCRLAPTYMFSYESQEIDREAWILGFVVPRDEIYAPLVAAQTNVARSLESILMIQAVVLVVVIVFLIGVTFFFTRRMTRGLASLSAGASQIAQGNLDTRVEILSTDEIGRSGSAFNEMARQLEQSFESLERRNIQLENEILERQQAEKELLESQERLRRVVENMPVMMDAFDAEGNILAWNKECERVTGYSAEEIVGNPRAMELLYPDPSYRERMISQLLERGNDYYNWEWELTARDGTAKTVAWSSISERFPIPGWAGWATGVDVTERVRAEEALRQEKEFTDTALDAQMDTFFLFDPASGKALRWNKAFRDISGYSDEEIASTPAPVSYYGPEDLKRALPFVEQVKKMGSGTIELGLVCKDGREVPTEYSASAIYDEEGRAKHFISIGRDITERKAAQEELEKHREHLEELVAERTADLRKLVNAMAGREVRMAELKDVIRLLRAQLEEAGLEPVADDPLLGR